MFVNDFNTVGNKLHSFRKKRGMTQAEVAEQAGLSDRTYAEIERGNVNMRIETFIRICKVLRVTSDEILIHSEVPAGVKQEEILQRLNFCTEKEKQVAFELLNVYLNSLE